MSTSTINPMIDTSSMPSMPSTESTVPIVPSTTEPDSAIVTKKRICFSSFASPFFFGPYGNQMYHLLTKFLNDDQYEMYYLLLINGLDDKMYTMEEVYNMELENELKEKMPSYVQLDLLKPLKFIGGIVKSPANGTILSSNINDLLEKHKIDSYLFLSDLNHIVPDKEFSCQSLCWYPNHLDPMVSLVRNTLPIFSDIVCLCPNDKQLVEKSILNRNVHYIPHTLIVDEKKLDWKKKQRQLRAKHQVPIEAFVVLINCGNYEPLNRKGLDSALMAFESFSKTHDNAYLFLHAWSLKNLQKAHHKASSNFFNPSEILECLDIPDFKVRIHEDIVDYDTILEFTAMSDVLLQGSRTEGFCVPILEAQLLQTPVISTAFGAMKDYTMYGISVPYLQKEYLQVAKGMWVIPSVQGMADALEKVYQKDPIGNAVEAQQKVLELTNLDSIVKQFQTIFKNSASLGKSVQERRVETICIRVHYNNESGEFDLYKNFESKLFKSVKKLSLRDLDGHWTCFFHSNITVDPMFFLFQAQFHNLILLKTLDTKEGSVYPNADEVTRGNVDFSIVNYAVNNSYLKHLFTPQLESIYNSHVQHYFLTHCVMHCKVALSDAVVAKV